MEAATADANGGDVGAHVLHGIVYAQTGVYTSARTVDVHVDVAVTIG